MSSTNKIGLIYEYNPDSPLFARVAAYKISKRNFEEANDILNKGIERFPNYPTPYILSGICFAYLGKYDEARKQINRAGKLLNSPKSIEFYLNQVQKIEEKKSGFARSKRNTFIDDDIDDLKKIEFKTDSAEIDRELNSNVEKLTNEIKRVKEFLLTSPEGKSAKSNANPFNINPKLVSETLANIFSQQGKYLEAISVYNELKNKFPEKVKYFDSKIEEVKKAQSENAV